MSPRKSGSRTRAGEFTGWRVRKSSFVPGHPYQHGFDLRLVPEKLEEPLKWRAPRFIFVNSMSDLFQVGVPDDYITRVAEVMTRAKWHTFQVLTKRGERMRALLNSKLSFAAHSP